MILAGAAALYFLGAGRWSIDSIWLEKDKPVRAGEFKKNFKAIGYLT